MISLLGGLPPHASSSLKSFTSLSSLLFL
uniref:Uncharacterized protein n=1 Tax=Arundo donax TaxID=35708 RepID=A0A0A9FPK1_ARUDO